MRNFFTQLFSLAALMFFVGVLSTSAQTYKPGDGDVNVDKTKEVSATFASDVTKGAGYVRFYQDEATDIPLFVELVSDSRIEVSGKKVLFKFNSLMVDSKDYYVTWDLGAFKLGTVNVAALTIGDWNWSTGDYIGPVLDVQTNGSHLNYKNGATNVVKAAATLTMLFKENVSVTAGDEKVYIMKENGGTYGDVVQVLTKANLIAAGKTMQIAIAALEENSTYYVLVEKGAIRDASVNINSYAGFNNKTTWSFSTKDETAPKMTITESAVTKTKVAYNVDLSEKGKLYYIVVAKGATAPTSAEVKAGANYGAVTVVAKANATYTAAGSKVVENTLTNNVQYGTEYDYYFVSETYINVDGVSETLLSPPVMKAVKMVDNVKPVLAGALVPFNGEENVAKDKKLKLTFDEKVMKGTGLVTVKKTVDNSVFATFDIAGAKISDNELEVEIALGQNFASSTQYYVLIPAGVITDKAENAYAGISSTVTWGFTAVDYAPPTYAYSPANGSSNFTDVTINGAGGIKITFNEAIQHRDGNAIVDDADLAASGLNQALILKEDGDEIAMNYSVTGGNVIMVSIDGGTFQANSEYSLTFLAWYVADLKGNAIQSSSELTFRTKDDVKPFVENIKPDAGKIEATSNITINFTEPIRLIGGTEITDTNVDGLIISFLKGTVPVDFDATVSADKKQIIINPASNLASSGSYDILLSANIEDFSKNAIAGTSAINFLVKDYIKPVAILTPANGASLVAGAATAGSVTFSEAVVKIIGGGDPDLSIVNLREGSATGPIVELTPVSTSTTAVNFTFTSSAATTYYLSVGSSVKDATGNVNEPKVSEFRTLSAAAPTIALDGDSKKIVTPKDGATAVAANAVVSVTFADPISAVVNEGLITITGATVTGSTLSADHKTLTISHTNIPANTDVTVNLAIGTVKSEDLTGQAGDLSWTFKSKDTVAPTAPVLSPMGAGVLVSMDPDDGTVLELTFANTDNLHLGVGDVKIRKTSGDAIVQQLGVANISVSSATADDGTNEIVTVKLNADLDYNTAYYVQVGASLILDAENNAYAGITSKTDWTFTTEAASAFVVDVAKSNPTAFQDSVLETADLMVKFNHDVKTKVSSKYITLDEVSFVAGGAITLVNNIFALPPSDPAFTWAGNSLSINYIVNLSPNKAYRLTLDSGVATDVYDGDLTGTSYVFFTSSRQGPIASFSPADKDKNVDKAANIVLTFDELFYKNASKTPYTALELQSGLEITVVGTGSGAHTYTVLTDGKVINLDVIGDFSSAEDVTVTVLAGKFFDAKGNAYDKDMNGVLDAQSAKFTTKDVAAPVASAAVTDGPSGTAFKYKVTSSEDGKVYSLVTLATVTPSKADIMAGTATDVKAATASDKIAVTGLSVSKAYKIWLFGVDKSGNELTPVSVTVTTIDDVAPVLVKTSPADGAAAADKIKIEFDEKIQAGTIVVLLKDKATGALIEKFTVGDFSVDKVVAFTPAVAFGSEHSYVVEVDGSSFKDLAGNAYEEFITWEFKTKDFINPTVKLSTPDNSKTPPQYNVENGTGLVLTFSEAVSAGSEKVMVYEDNAPVGTIDGSDILVQIIDPASMTASADNKTRTFDITAPLAEGKTYAIVVAAKSFKDIAKNDLAAEYIGKIVIVDTSAPVASHEYSPAATDDKDVAASASIIINFDEKIYWSLYPVDGYLHNDNVDSLVTLTGPNGAVKFDATINIANQQIVIIPDKTLSSVSTYVVTASQIEDANGNIMDTYSFTFKTGEFTPPVAIFDPAHGTKKVSEVGPLTITFDEEVYVYVDITTSLPILAALTTENVKDYITLVSGDDIDGGTAVAFSATVTGGKVVTITPDKALNSSGADKYTYGIIVDEKLLDNQGNALTGLVKDDDNAGVTYATFTVKDLTKPTWVAKAPNGGTDIDAKMWIKFNEDVAIGAGNLYIRRVEDGEVMQKIAANAANLTISKDTAFIAHTDFSLATNYYVVMDAGFITDVAGNGFDGIANNDITKWNFNTVDTHSPYVTNQSPADGDVDVLVNQVLKLTFNKAVEAGTGFISIYEADGTPFQMVAVPSGLVMFGSYAADTVVTISHNTFAAEKEYFVRINAEAIVDGAGNKFDGIAEQDWSFTTEDITAPSVDALNPDDDSEGVAVRQVFSITFDRNVAKGAGNIKIYGKTGEDLVETLPISSPSVKVDMNVVSFNFASALEYLTEYYIIVEKGAVTNASVNAIPFNGILTALEWNFTTTALDCKPITVTPTVVEQGECSSLVDVMVVADSTVSDYILTMNGDTIVAGEMTLASGSYTFVASYLEGACTGTATLEVEAMPVVKTDIVETYLGAPAHYVNEEAGLDTMLVVGEHTIMYDYMGCERTLIVLVTETMRTPTIKDIQGETDQSPLVGEMVHIMGTVSAVAPGEGFFMQDANAAWSGIWVEFSDASYEGIQIGNGVSVVGEVAEVANVTSIVSDVVEFIPPMLTLAPVMVSPSDLEAEMYESVLVKVEGALASAADAGNGEWTISHAAGNMATVNDWLYNSMPVEGHYFDVAGIVNARLDNFKLEPRMESDVKDLTLTSVNPVEANTFKVYPNPFNDRITIDNYDKLTRVVVSNIAGQRVIDIEYPTREIRTANLVSGIYVISLYTENGVAKSERIIKR